MVLTPNTSIEARIAKGIGRITKWGGLTLLAVWLFFTVVFTVDAGERGVLITFGEASTVVLQPGIHFKIPWVQKVVRFETRTQKYDATSSAASKDLQVVTATITTNYHVIPESVPSIYRDLGIDYASRVVQPAEQEVVKAVTARFTAEELITKRPEVALQIQEGLVERLGMRGILVESISITNFDFSPSFNEAIESKVTAEQLKLKAERDLERIRVEAEQVAVTARGARDAAIAQAQGQSEAIALVQEQLRRSPEYVEWFKVSKWSGELPLILSTGGSGVIPLVDVGGLIK